MPYIPNAEDVDAPLITEIAKTAAAEFRTIKVYMQTLRDIPVAPADTWKRGHCRVLSGDVTINTTDMAAGYSLSCYNNTDGDVDLIQGVGVTLRLSGSILTGHRTIGPRGLVTLWCASGAEVIAIGAGLS